MNFLRNSIRVALLVASFSSATASQNQSVTGPILGFTNNDTGTAIWPILGVPGAAIIGDRINLGTGIRNAVISSQQNYALAVRNEDTLAVIIPLNPDLAPLTSIAGGLVAADRIALSPTGTAAALYAHASKRLQLIRRLPHAPEIVHEFDLSGFEAWPGSVAVSDDGAVALMSFTDRGSSALWVADAEGSLWSVAFTHPSAVAFFPQRRDAIVADEEGQYVLLLLDVDQKPTQVPLIPYIEGVKGYSAVAASEDGRRIFITGSESENIAIVDVETRTHTLVPCSCRPTGLHALAGTSVFRLNEADSGPLDALDASLSEPRIVVIPPLLRDRESSAGGRILSKKTEPAKE